MAKIIIDFDQTIVDFTKSLCKTYEDLYSHLEAYHPININNGWFYDYDIILHRDGIQSLASTDRFFENLELFPDASDVLELLVKKYNHDITLCTIGCSENLYRKTLYMKEKLPFINKLILLTVEVGDKSIINMEGYHFIDDLPKNLYNSNADYKHCYGMYEHNKGWKGSRFTNYEQVYSLFATHELL